MPKARFVEYVTAAHPLAESKPCLIGNCRGRLADPADVRHPSGPSGTGSSVAGAPLIDTGAGVRVQKPDALLRWNARRQLAPPPP